METDIAEELRILSKHVQDVGRNIGSAKIDIEGLTHLQEALKLNASTIGTYIDILKDRLK